MDTVARQPILTFQAMHPLDKLFDSTRAIPAAATPPQPPGRLAPVVAGGAAAVVAAVVPGVGPGAPAWLPSLPAGWESEEIPWPAPCPRCGSLQAWWDMTGRQRCQVCEAKTFARGLRFVFRAARLRGKR